LNYGENQQNTKWNWWAKFWYVHGTWLVKLRMIDKDVRELIIL
jgi:hypothetical protein